MPLYFYDAAVAKRLLLSQTNRLTQTDAFTLLAITCIYSIVLTLLSLVLGRTAPVYMDVSLGIAAIVLSVICLLLCCIFIPVAIFFYRKQKRRIDNTVPVIYRGK